MVRLILHKKEIHLVRLHVFHGTKKRDKSVRFSSMEAWGISISLNASPRCPLHGKHSLHSPPGPPPLQCGPRGLSIPAFLPAMLMSCSSVALKLKKNIHAKSFCALCTISSAANHF